MSTLTFTGIGSSPVDLVILIDTSEMDSTAESLREQQAFRDFFSKFLQSADIDGGAVQVALVTYSTHPEIVFRLNTYQKRTDIQDAIREANFLPGERNTADAIDTVRRDVLIRSAGDRPNIPNIVLLLHTGRSDRNQARTIQEIEALKYARASIFGLGYKLDATGR